MFNFLRNFTSYVPIERTNIQPIQSVESEYLLLCSRFYKDPESLDTLFGTSFRLSMANGVVPIFTTRRQIWYRLISIALITAKLMGDMPLSMDPRSLNSNQIFMNGTIQGVLNFVRGPNLRLLAHFHMPRCELIDIPEFMAVIGLIVHMVANTNNMCADDFIFTVDQISHILSDPANFTDLPLVPRAFPKIAIVGKRRFISQFSIENFHLLDYHPYEF